MASNAGLDAFSRPVAYADDNARTSFLQNVALWTLGGLGIAGVSAVLMMMAVMAVPALQHRYVMLGILLGSFFLAQNVASNMVFGGQKVAGFVFGMVSEGVAMGYLLLAAVTVGARVYGEGFEALTILAQAGGLTGLTVLSMTVYLWAAPKNLSMIGGALSVMFVPMLVLMAISFVFPIGGVFGILISGLFVVVSGAGLLYNLNQVIHTMRTDMHVEGAYTIALGMLVLFWNLVVLLMKLTDRR
ncbi:MAG: Bax inhibitor-1 family protein [Alphaproteobacteria bacterium]|nr:Bax inhibitor-1 family protein [Alphaproteobacteria bacterium]